MSKLSVTIPTEDLHEVLCKMDEAIVALRRAILHGKPADTEPEPPHVDDPEDGD